MMGNIRRKAGKKALPALAILAAVLFSACLGASTEITVRRDGSGAIALEYRVSRELESLGKLDGNERWPPLPVGKADFERTAARIEGLSLRSFNAKTTDTDMVYQVKLDFASLDALARFLDSTGQQASVGREGGRNRLSLAFDGVGGADPQLLALASASLEGYSLAFGIALPQAPELRVLDGKGRTLAAPPAGTLAVQGNRVSFAAPMAELLSAAEPTRLEILW